ncbi:hypothetical protein [Nocardia sp. NPDC057353]|uniref:hypothetical protein n=1 Tax=Nocardia sp. NPDC057353 TaxID=3346104 RepID=UPI003636A73C
MTVDETWARYEDAIPSMIESIKKPVFPGLIKSTVWMQTLLPLVAGLFVRGSDFDHGKRVVRFDSDGNPIDFAEKTMSNLARLPEQIRLLAPLMAAEWGIVKFDEGGVISSDRGYTLIGEEGKGIVGIAVPLSPRHVMTVKIGSRNTIAVALKGDWYTPLRMSRGTARMATDISRSMARNARDFIIGPNREQVAGLREQLGEGLYPPPAPLHGLWGTDRDLRTNTLEWETAYREIGHPPDRRVLVNVQRELTGKRVSANPNGWFPPVFLYPVGQVNRATGVQRYGEIIKYDLTVRPGARDFYELQSMVIKASAVPPPTIYPSVNISVGWHSAPSVGD